MCSRIDAEKTSIYAYQPRFLQSIQILMFKVTETDIQRKINSIFFIWFSTTLFSLTVDYFYKNKKNCRNPVHNASFDTLNV